ncbi:hypothetical protein [Paludisphaera borealis]|uniref:Uncharacterized protein n=1 Tax=Paludisphaera borealis TaxID=1387353 RepID=A0A1U7CKD6_9BACT|nr:hypothetical protein [Paludisphaera borealis]APW59400.1 hypothetical protein BSF38_00823 [Paludisphaera borealis]
MSSKYDRANVVGETRARAFFKPLLVGQIVSLLILFAVFSVAGFFGVDVIFLNRRPVHGPTALAVGSVVAVVFTLVFAPLYAAFVCLGLWIFSRFRRLMIRVDSTYEDPSAESAI